MSMRGIATGEPRLGSDPAEAIGLVSPTDGAVNAKAVGILGAQPLKDTLYDFLIGGGAGAFVGLAVLLAGPSDSGQTFLASSIPGFVGGAVGAAAASVAYRIIHNGKIRPTFQMITSILGVSLAVLSICNATSWYVPDHPLPLSWQFGIAGIGSGVALLFNFLARGGAIPGFFSGMGVGSICGLGSGACLGMLLPLGPSFGGMCGSFVGLAGATGVVRLALTDARQ